MFQEQRLSPKRKFWAGYPCRHLLRSDPPNLGKTSIVWHGHARTSMTKFEKHRADFSFSHAAGCFSTRCCLNPWFAPWRLRGFPDFRGFCDLCESSTQLVVCSCVSCLRRFRRFRDFRRFRERRPACKQ